MSTIASELVNAIVRGTALLSLAAIAVIVLLWFLRIRSAKTQWRAWFTVLLCGLGVTPLTLHVPWLTPETPVAVTLPAADLPAPPTIELNAPEPAPLEPAPLESTADIDPPAPATEAPIAAPRTITPPPEPKTAIPGKTIAAATWALGLAFILARGLWRYARFARSSRSCIAAPESWAAPWNALLAANHVKRPVPMLVGESYGPALARLPRGYALIVPRSMWAEISEDARDVILRHELAHYTRGDLAWSLAARWLAAPHWFNPLAHLAIRKLDEAAEWSCDDAATGGDATRQIALSKTLLGLSETPGIPGAMQAAIGGRALAVRIRRLLEPTQAKETVMRKLAIATTLLACLLTAGVRVELVAQEPAAQPAADKPPTAATKPTLPAIPREELRYDGKSFEEWQRVFQTELKTERRTEAVGAMLVFAENGYAPEAVETVIAVLNTYKPVVPNQPENDLFRAIESMLERADPNTTYKQLVNVLNESNSKAAQRVALTVLESSNYRDVPTEAALLKFGSDKSKDSALRFSALFALQVVDPENPNLIEAIRGQIADDDSRNDHMLSQWMSLAVMKSISSPYDPQGGFGGSNKTTVRAALVPILIDALRSNNKQLSAAAVESLTETGDAMGRVLPQLLEIASSDEGLAGAHARTAIIGHALTSPEAMQTIFRALEPSDKIRFLKVMRGGQYGIKAEVDESWLSFFKGLSDDGDENEDVRQLAKEVHEVILNNLKETQERAEAIERELSTQPLQP
jgi:beta-lactamase regulating signal transducer with metallopeptidase domain